MFVQQVRSELSPYLEFDELDTEKARVAFNNVVRLTAEIKDLDKEIRKLEKRLR